MSGTYWMIGSFGVVWVFGVCIFWTVGVVEKLDIGLWVGMVEVGSLLHFGVWNLCLLVLGSLGGGIGRWIRWLDGWKMGSWSVLVFGGTALVFRVEGVTKCVVG